MRACKARCKRRKGWISPCDGGRWRGRAGSSPARRQDVVHLHSQMPRSRARRRSLESAAKGPKRVSQGRLSAQRQPRQDHACSAHATFREEVWRGTRWVGPEQRRGANRAHLLTVRLISIILADKRSSISRAPHDAVHDGRGRRC